jgi:hypothetical protein
MLPLSILVCSGLSVWSTYIHRPFKLSMVLRLKMPSSIEFDMVSSFIDKP